MLNDGDDQPTASQNEEGEPVLALFLVSNSLSGGG